MIEKIRDQSPFQLSIKILGFLLIVALVAWIGDLAWHAISLRLSLQALSSMSQSGIENVSMEQLNGLLAKTDLDLTAIDRDVSPLFPVFRACSGIPFVGKYAGQIEPGLQYATGLVKAGSLIFQGLQPILDAIDQKEDKDIMSTLVQTLQSSRLGMQQAAVDIDSAAHARIRLDPTLLPENLKSKFLKLDTNFELLQGGVAFLQILPGILGADRTKTYLVVAQNSDELRATGGFITAIGLLDLANGKVTRFDIQDSYKADDLSKNYPVPPDPLRRFMQADIWLPRDANWSPDFPTSARKVQELYQISTNIKTDGVIAFDQTAVSSLLEVFGQVNVPGFSEPVNAGNVQNYMQEAWAPAPDQGFSQQWWENRKNFIPELGKLLLQKILSSRDKSVLFNLATTSLDDLQSGHVLVYFSDPGAHAAQQALATMGLDNAVNPGAGDFLELVDSNIGFNKTDTVVNRSIQYKVDLTNPAQPKAEFSAHYQHTVSVIVPCVQEAEYSQTYQGMQLRCYWDYWRVLTRSTRLTASQVASVPADQLLDKQAWDGTLDVTAGEGNTQAIGGLMVLPTRQTRDIVLKYDLLPGVVQANQNELVYTLHIHKQPGLVKLPLTLQVISPENYVLSSPPTGSQSGVEGHSWTWNGTLIQPLDFKLIFTKP